MLLADISEAANTEVGGLVIKLESLDAANSVSIELRYKYWVETRQDQHCEASYRRRLLRPRSMQIARLWCLLTARAGNLVICSGSNDQNEVICNEM